MVSPTQSSKLAESPPAPLAAQSTQTTEKTKEVASERFISIPTDQVASQIPEHLTHITPPPSTHTGIQGMVESVINTYSAPATPSALNHARHSDDWSLIDDQTAGGTRSPQEAVEQVAPNLQQINFTVPTKGEQAAATASLLEELEVNVSTPQTALPLDSVDIDFQPTQAQEGLDGVDFNMGEPSDQADLREVEFNITPPPQPGGEDSSSGLSELNLEVGSTPKRRRSEDGGDIQVSLRYGQDGSSVRALYTTHQESMQAKKLLSDLKMLSDTPPEATGFYYSVTSSVITYQLNGTTVVKDMHHVRDRLSGKEAMELNEVVAQITDLVTAKNGAPVRTAVRHESESLTRSSAYNIGLVRHGPATRALPSISSKDTHSAALQLCLAKTANPRQAAQNITATTKVQRELGELMEKAAQKIAAAPSQTPEQQKDLEILKNAQNRMMQIDAFSVSVAAGLMPPKSSLENAPQTAQNIYEAMNDLQSLVAKQEAKKRSTGKWIPNLPLIRVFKNTPQIPVDHGFNTDVGALCFNGLPSGEARIGTSTWWTGNREPVKAAQWEDVPLSLALGDGNSPLLNTLLDDISDPEILKTLETGIAQIRTRAQNIINASLDNSDAPDNLLQDSERLLEAVEKATLIE